MKCTQQLKKCFRASPLSGAGVFMAAILAAQVGYAEEASIQPKIFNGTSTTTQAWPWMVALISNNKANVVRYVMSYSNY